MTGQITRAESCLRFLAERKQQIVGVVPRTLRQELTWESIRGNLQAELTKSEQLAACEPRSIYNSVLYILRLGLDIGGASQQAFLVPYKRDCTPIIGAQGKIELAMRSGRIARIVVQAVHEHDDVVLDFLRPKNNKHRPCLTRDRGDVVCVYAEITLTGGEKLLEVMNRDDFDRLRRGKTSPAYRDWPVEMWRRSCLNRALKRAPKSVDLMEVLDSQGAIDAGGRVVASSSGAVDVIDAEPDVLDDTPALPDYGEDVVDEEPEADPEPVERRPVERRQPERRPAERRPSPPDDDFGGMP